MMSLWDALRMNMMISYQELVRTFPKKTLSIIAVNNLHETVVLKSLIKQLFLDITTPWPKPTE